MPTRRKPKKSGRPTVAKGRRMDAERAAEHYLYEVCGCDPKQMRRAVRSKFQSVDFWAADVAGRTPAGECFYAQATAGQGESIRRRRRKLEAISWNAFDTVLLLQLVETPDPVVWNKKNFFFRVHHYDHVMNVWTVNPNPWPVPRNRFKSLQNVLNPKPEKSAEPQKKKAPRE